MILAVTITLWVLIVSCAIIGIAVMFGVGKYADDPFLVRLFGLIATVWQIMVYLFILGLI